MITMMERSHLHSSMHGNNDDNITDDYLAMGGDGGNGGDGEEFYVLPPDFVPGKWDVICQRGKECFEHVGNRRFRVTIDNHLDKYMEVKSRQQKSRIVTTIVDNIKRSAGKEGGGFVRKDLLTRRWFRVSDKLAREKVGQALRDAIKTRRASDKKAAVTEKVATAESLSHMSQMEKPRQPQHLQYSRPHQPGTAISSSSEASELRQQHFISSVPEPLSHPPENTLAPAPHPDHSLFGDLEPRPLSLPLKLGDFFLTSGGYDGDEHVSNSMMNRLQQQQVELNSIPTAAAMNASLSTILGQTTSKTGTSSHLQAIYPGSQPPLFPSTTTSNALPQYQQLSTSSTLPPPGLSQLLYPTSREPHSFVAPSSLPDYSFPSLEQQQMLSSVIGHSRLPSNGGSGNPSGQSLEESPTGDDVNFGGNSFWLGAGSGVNPLDIGNMSTLTFYKQQAQQAPSPPRSPQSQQQLQEHRHSSYERTGL